VWVLWHLQNTNKTKNKNKTETKTKQKQKQKQNLLCVLVCNVMRRCRPAPSHGGSIAASHRSSDSGSVDVTTAAVKEK
jgi:hypothetical protein